MERVDANFACGNSMGLKSGHYQSYFEHPPVLRGTFVLILLDMWRDHYAYN